MPSPSSRTEAPPRATTFLLLASGMALFGSATPVSKIVGESMPAVLGSALRMATAALVLVPLLVAQRRRSDEPLVPRLDRGDWLRVAGIAVIGTFGFTLLLLLGLRLVPGAVGAIVMATTPGVTALGAVLFLGERIDARTVVGLALAVTGAGLVNVFGGDQGGGGDVWLGSLLVLGAVACEATYSLLGKRLTADLTPLAIASLAAVLAGLLFAPIAAVQATGFDWGRPSWTDWVAVVFWGAGTMGLGSVLWFRGMRRTTGTTASAFMAVMPVSALLLSYLLLGESPEWIHAVGGIVVVAGIVAVSRGSSTPH